MTTYTLKVVGIKKETDDSITLCFNQPGLRKIKYLAGQYLTLIFRINGRRYIRPYSFSSAPAIDKQLEVTIKRIQNGVVSNHIHDTVKVGDSIEVLQPMGDFVCEEPLKQVFLWGVGSGITPLMSIAKQILFTHPMTKVVLSYGNKNHETTIFFLQLQKLKEQFADRLTINHFYTKMSVSEEVPNIIEGRIDKVKAMQILTQLDSNTGVEHYICGPAGLKQSVKAALLANGTALDHLHSEDFELVRSPEDFKDIMTRTVKIKFELKEFELEVTKGRSILESALDAGIELPYSCQTGNCSTCKGILRSGKLRMIGLSSERNDLLHNEYLVCCSHPVSEDVYIEFE